VRRATLFVAVAIFLATVGVYSLILWFRWSAQRDLVTALICLGSLPIWVAAFIRAKQKPVEKPE